MPRLDPAWLDQQYNNRARVPEHVQILERWALASAHAREGLDHHLDLPYGDDPGQTLDVFPAKQPGSPVLVFIHGGWWRSLDKQQHSFIAPTFVHHGAMVVVPNYALCPAVSIATITLQLVQAMVWTYRHAAEHGGDPRRIVVAGHSAGGHLATMLLCCNWPSVAPDLPQQLVRSAMSISGLVDLEPIRHIPFLTDDLRLSAADARRLSPACFPRPAGTLYAAVGADESEEFLRQNALIQKRWGADCVPVCEAIPDTNHFDVLHDLADPAGRLNGLAQQLLDATATRQRRATRSAVKS